MTFFNRRILAPVPVRFEVATDDGPVAVDLRRHPRARNFTLRVVGPTRQPVLTMPKRGSLTEARRFLDRHSGWLKRQIDKLPPPTAIAAGSTVPVRGVAHVVVPTGGRRGTVGLGERDGVPALMVPGEAEHLRRRVIDFLKREAKRDLEWAVIRHSLAAGVRARAIRVRDQSSRWGSCTPEGLLSFSWRLVMAPPHVLDYLAAHEVAHLVELNHSPRFWRLCRQLCAETEAARAWLNADGATLHAIGAG
jgi:predicted metal-dependent hydrolase